MTQEESRAVSRYSTILELELYVSRGVKSFRHPIHVRAPNFRFCFLLWQHSLLSALSTLVSWIASMENGDELCIDLSFGVAQKLYPLITYTVRYCQCHFLVRKSKIRKTLSCLTDIGSHCPRLPANPPSECWLYCSTKRRTALNRRHPEIKATIRFRLGSLEPPTIIAPTSWGPMTNQATWEEPFVRNERPWSNYDFYRTFASPN